MNHNQILGISSNATSSEIQAAFRKAALEAHPDHSDSPEAAEAFGRIKEARDELIKRARLTEAARDSDSIQNSTASAIKATSNAAFSSSAVNDLYDGFTPEEVAHIQTLDRIIMQKPKKSLFRRAKESAEIRRHRNKINTSNDRIIGKY